MKDWGALGTSDSSVAGVWWGRVGATPGGGAGGPGDAAACRAGVAQRPAEQGCDDIYILNGDSAEE